MDTGAKAAAIIAGISAAISVLALIANIVLSRISAKTAIGMAETNLKAAIRSSRISVRELTLKIGDLMDGRRPDQLTAADRRRFDIISVAFNEAVEDNLNAYEDACAKYLDNKIDRKRFKKDYGDDIRDLCESHAEEIRAHLHPEATSRFQSLWRVYRRWHQEQR